MIKMKYEPLSKLYYKDKAKYKQEKDMRKYGVATYHLPINIHENESYFVNDLEISMLIEKIFDRHNNLIIRLGELPGVSIHFLIKNLIVSEVYLTNGIEGVRSTRKEIYDVLNDDTPERKNKRFAGLIHKYILLLNDDFYLSLKNCQDFRKLYDEIVKNEIEEKDLPDGKFFRKDGVDVTTGTNKIIHKGLFPEKKIITEMENVIKILEDENIPKIITIGLVHYFIGYIHPFYDGNGRFSRFISSYLLTNLFHPMVSLGLSYSIKGNTKRYYEAFEDCNDRNNNGDVTPFIIAFLKFILDTINHILNQVNKKSIKMNELQEKIAEYYYAMDFSKTKKANYSFVTSILMQNSLFLEDEAITVKDISNAGRGLNEITSPALIRKCLTELLDLGLPIVLDKEGHHNTYYLDLEKFEDYLDEK